MCGIAGAVGKRDDTLIQEMTAALAHRGPDGEGIFRTAHFDLGVRRLAVIDLISGDQPITNETGDKRIVFNGEIYNYGELRHELEDKGHQFRTKTDTEAILHCYEEYGERCLLKLNGMFAFAIADGDTLFLARDRLGIKPLYYAHLKARGCFLFASEIKALLRCPELPTSLDRETLADQLIAGYAIGDRTIFEGIGAVRPGHYMRITHGSRGLQCDEREYWRVAIEPDDSLDYEESETTLCALLKNAVRSHLTADVDIGLALSGGIDSTTLALITEAHYPKRLSTFTLSDDRRSADLASAKTVAGIRGYDHHEIIPAFEDFFHAIPRIILALEDPFSSPASALLLYREIGKLRKVCLIGEGADEVFGGYEVHVYPPWLIAHLRNGLASAKLLGLAPGDGVEALVEHLSSAQNQNERLERLSDFLLRDRFVHHHLELLDKLAMAFGLEMRVPFLDNAVVDFANRFPLHFKVRNDLRAGKYILRGAARRLFNGAIAEPAAREKTGMPDALRNHYLRFLNLCDGNLPDEYVKTHELGEFFLHKTRNEWDSAKCGLLLFDLFLFIFIGRRGSIPGGFNLREFMEEKSGKRLGEAGGFFRRFSRG